MGQSNHSTERNIGKTLILYLGSAWIFIEAFNFAIDKYRLDAAYLDVIILLVIFGLPAAIIHAWFSNQFTRKAIILHSINITLAVGVIGFDLVNPDSIHPTRIRLLNFQSNQKKLAESIRSIAILPFTNYTGDSEKEFLSAGIHDALISEIGQVGAIRVISRTSTLSYTKTEKNIQQIASELDVDAIIEGSLLLADDIIRVQVKLIIAFPEELQLWTHTYDAPLNDLLKVYGNMTKNIVQEVNITLTPEEESLLTKSKTVDPDAYEAYLKGKYSMGLLSQEGIQAAMGHFQKAIEIDPDFAPAYGGLGGIWAFLKQMNIVTTDVASPNITSNLNKAKELDSTLADVYYWDAVKNVWTDFNWDDGEQSFKRALELNPNFSEARGLYSNYLGCMTRFDESEEQMALAIRSDPNNPFIKVLKAVSLMRPNSHQASIELLEPMQISMPTNPLINFVLFSNYGVLGNEEKCFEQAKLMLQLEKHDDIIPLLEKAYKKDGLKEALHIAAKEMEKKDSELLHSQTMYSFYALAGDTDKTMDWVEKGFIRKDPDMPALKVMPLLKPYHNETRFIEIASRMKLPKD